MMRQEAMGERCEERAYEIDERNEINETSETNEIHGPCRFPAPNFPFLT